MTCFLLESKRKFELYFDNKRAVTSDPYSSTVNGWFQGLPLIEREGFESGSIYELAVWRQFILQPRDILRANRRTKSQRPHKWGLLSAVYMVTEFGVNSQLTVFSLPKPWN
jgi:hypothetical protein